MLKTKTGDERELYMKLYALPTVEEVHKLYSEFDFIVKMQPDDDEHEQSIIDNVSSIDEVFFVKALQG